MDDNSKTIAQILKEIDDKTADRSEVLPLLKNIERNTGNATATAIGTVIKKTVGTRTKSYDSQTKDTISNTASGLSASTEGNSVNKPLSTDLHVIQPAPEISVDIKGVELAVEKAMVKATARSEKRQRTSTAGKRQQQASTAIVTSSKKSNSSPGRERSGPVLVHTRDKTGRFVANAPGSTRNIAAEQKQDAQNDKLSSILKDAVMQKKDTIKDTAGKLAFGPFWDIGKELKEAADAMKDNAKDEKSTMGRLKNWGKGTRLGKAAGNAKDRVVAKYQDRKAAKAGTATAAGATVVNNGGNSPGVLERAQQIKDLKDSFKGRKGVKVSRAGSAGRGVAGSAARGGGMIARGAGAAGGMLSSVGRMIGPLLSGISLPLVAAAGAAAFGLQQFYQSLTTGKSAVSDFVDGLVKKVTGDKNATLGGKAYDATQSVKDALGFGPGKTIRETIGNFESGKAGYGAYQNKDAGIVSYGKYQFTAHNGKSSSLAQVLDQYASNGGAQAEQAKKYSEIIKNGGGAGLRNDKGFEAMLKGASGEKAMQDAQEQTFDKRYYNPAMAFAQKSGINVVRNQRVAGFLADTNVQGGMQDVTASAQKKLAAQGLDFKTATEDQQLQALSEARKERLLRVAADKEAKGDTTTARMLRNDASSGGRVDKLVGQLKNTKIDTSRNYETATAAQEGKKAEQAQAESTTSPPTTAPGKKTAKPQQAATGGGQKASGAGPASSQVVPNDAPVPTTGKAVKTDPKAAETTTTGTVVKKEEPSKFSKEQADSEYATAESEKKAALDAHWSKYRPQIDAMEKSGDISGATKLAKEANAIQGDIYADYNKKTDAIRAKEAAAKDTTATGTVVKKEEPPQPGQPATATALPPATPATDPSVVTGTATMSPKQYGAGDIFNERKSIDEASKQKKAKMLSDFRSGKTSEADYVKAVAEEDKSRNEKKDSLAALTKKAESGQFVSQEEMDKATGKAASQPDKVQALSATQPPLPEVQRLQPAPPPPMEVPAIDKLAKAQEQQAQAQQQNSSKAQDGSGKQGIPNIKTDFDDTMLVLMSYDRT